MTNLQGLILFWSIPVGLFVCAAVAVVLIGRKQAKELKEWKEANNLLTERIEQSSERIEQIEKKLKDLDKNG